MNLYLQDKEGCLHLVTDLDDKELWPDPSIFDSGRLCVLHGVIVDKQKLLDYDDLITDIIRIRQEILEGE